MKKEIAGYVLMVLAIALFFGGDLLIDSQATTPLGLNEGASSQRHSLSFAPAIGGVLFFVGIVLVVRNRNWSGDD